VDLTKEQIKNGPEWDPRSPINREYEERLYDAYGRPAYWL
jgi:stress response protein YsnF